MSTVAVIVRLRPNALYIFVSLAKMHRFADLRQLALMRTNASLLTFPYIVKFASNFVDTNIIDYDSRV